MPAADDVDAAYRAACDAFDRAVAHLDAGDVDVAANVLDDAAALVRACVAAGATASHVAGLTAAWQGACAAAEAARGVLDAQSRELNANARARRAYTSAPG